MFDGLLLSSAKSGDRFLSITRSVTIWDFYKGETSAKQPGISHTIYSLGRFVAILSPQLLLQTKMAVDYKRPSGSLSTNKLQRLANSLRHVTVLLALIIILHSRGVFEIFTPSQAHFAREKS